MDGSTDASILEREAIFAITFNPSPPGTDKIGAKVSYLDLADLHGADANSVLKSIKVSVKSVYGDEFMPKLVGFGSDGASVNTRKKKVKNPAVTRKPLVHVWMVCCTSPRASTER